MRSRPMWLMVLFVLSLAPAFTVMSGCGNKAAYTPDEAAKPSLWRFFRLHRSEKAQDTALTAEAATTGEAAAKPGSFAWTEKPTLALIPAGTITGEVNGKPFKAKLVRLEHSLGEISLVISDLAPDKPSGMIIGNTGVELSVMIPEGKTGEMLKGLQDSETPKKTGHAWYHYDQGGDRGPMSMNPEWAAALQITEWKLAQDPKDPEIVGTAKGKIALCFGDDNKSWVAGTFEGVELK